MEDQTQRTRLRFRSMLDSARQAADWAADGRSAAIQTASLVTAATNAMNRATGFLEAVSILRPELGPEMLEEFELLASRVETIFVAAQINGERRYASAGESRSDRRGGDRRLQYERRHHSMAIPVERRQIPDRRGEPDRRTGKIRELADRRWRAIQH